jgi:hypothetical protein
MSDSEIRKLPPEAEALLDDPQLAGLRYRGPGLPKEGKALQPSEPAKVGESPFLIFQTDAEYIQIAQVVWENRPTPLGSLGDGNGFPTLKRERPRFTVDKPKPDVVPPVWEYAGWLIASPQFVSTLRAFDADAIETVEIDWIYADGQKLDGYVFLDVRRVVHAYDYRRSVVYVQMGANGKFISNLGVPRALKRDLPSGVHVFREAYWRHQCFFSRELARALMQMQAPGFYFEDPAGRGAVKF